MSISLLYSPLKFQIVKAKDNKKFDFSLGGLLFVPHPVYHETICVTFSHYSPLNASIRRESMLLLNYRLVLALF